MFVGTTTEELELTGAEYAPVVSGVEMEELELELTLAVEVGVELGLELAVEVEPYSVGAKLKATEALVVSLVSTGLAGVDGAAIVEALPDECTM